MTRRPLTPLRKLKLFEGAQGKCHLCDLKIQVGERWEVEHVIPLAMGGADDESNMRPAHVDCHKEKTRDDRRNLAKVDRLRAKHLGAWKPSGFRKLPPGWKYSWRLGRATRVE